MADNIKIAKEKLAILYIIRQSGIIHSSQLSNLILEYDILNFFDYVKYFKELEDSGFLDIEEDSQVVLTSFSHQALELMDSSINSDLKEIVDNIFKVDVSKENLNDGYNLCLTDYDKDLEFTLSLTMDDPVVTTKIKKLWNKNPDKIYNLIQEMIKGVVI